MTRRAVLEWLGPVLTLGVVAALEALSHSDLPITAREAVYLLAVGFVTHTLGLRAGLASAAVVVGYAAYFGSMPGQWLTYDQTALVTVGILAVAAPSTALLVGLLGRQLARIARSEADRASEVAAGQAAMEARLRETDSLLAIARVVGGTSDLVEALRLICRELARLTGAETVAAHVLDGERQALRPTAGYHLPREMLEVLGTTPVPLAELAFRADLFERGQVVWSDAVPGDPRFAFTLCRRYAHQSALAIPLVLDGQVSGSFYLVWWKGARRFDAPELAALKAIGEQVGVVLRNARLYEALEVHARRLESLTQLTRTITGSLDPEVIMPAVAEAALSLFPGAACRLWIAEREQLRLRGEAGLAPAEIGGPEPMDLDLSDPLVGQACRTGEPVLCEDLAALPRSAHADWLRAQGFTFAAALPLQVGGRPVGACLLLLRGRRVLSPDEVRVLQAFAEQAAVALEKARLFQDTQERRRLSERLYELTVAMERVSDARARVDVFVDTVARALPFDRCNVFLPTDDGLGLELVAGTDRDPSRRILVPLAGGGACEVSWRSGEVLVVSADEQLRALPPLSPALAARDELRSRRFAVIPLLFRGRPLGLVSADNKRTRRTISARAVAQLQLFCQQLEHSLSAALLTEETHRREREARLLYEATGRLAATLDAEEILAIVTESTVGALGCESAAFYRWDASRHQLVLHRGHRLGPNSGPNALAPGEGVAGRAFAERGPVWRDAAVAAAPGRPEATGAAVAVPVVIGEEVYGVLEGRRGDPHEHHEAEVRLLASLAAQAAVALEKATLHGATQQHLAGAALLNEAARTLHRTLDVRRLLPDALASLGVTFGASGTAVALFDEHNAASVQVIRAGALGEAEARALTDALRRRAQPLLVPDAATSPEMAGLGPEVSGRGAVAAFPVRGRSRVLAGLALRFPGPRAFAEAEVRLLAAYADQLAMALDNASLFEEAANKRTQLEQVFASTSDGFLVLDLGGRILGLNRQGALLLGLGDEADLLGRTFAELVDELRGVAAWDEPGGQTLATILARMPEPRSGDLHLGEASHRRTLRWHAAPTRDLLGSAVGVTITLRDVTREREIDRMKTEFVSTVSHELRTPLTSVKGSLHLLLSDDGLVLDGTQHQLLDISLKNTDRLIRLINDILDVSKIEAGQIRLDLASHRARDFVISAVDGIAGFADSRAVTIDVLVPESLPALRVDFDRMVQVVTNLLSNAIKFSPRGSQVTVTAAQVSDRDEVELRVVDKGRGMSAQDAARLFQKFQQLDGSSIREVGGTGLGLFICRGIVEEHGGAIRVESAPAAGATFVVTLPIDDPAARAPVAAAPAAVGAASDLASPLILVVDDERDLREAISAQLEVAGYRVAEAAGALEAIEVARQRRPDLITMDLMMPDLDGLEAVRLLREHPETRETPVIMVTATDLDPREFGPQGPSGYLTKPFFAEDLLTAVRSNLRAHRAAS